MNKTPNFPPALEIKRLLSGQEYREERAKLDTATHYSPEGLRSLHIASLAGASIRIAENEQKYSAIERELAPIAGTMGSYTRAQWILDTARHEKRYERSKFLPQLEEVTTFNHNLKQVIENHTNLTRPFFEQYLTSLYVSFHGEETSKYFAQHLGRDLTGMQHEIGFAQILAYIDNLHFREGTIQEDMDGTDIFLFRNGRELRLNIKSTPEKALEANEKAKRYWGDTSKGRDIAIESGLDRDDFRGKFFVPSAVAESKAEETDAHLVELFAQSSTPLAA